MDPKLIKDGQVRSDDNLDDNDLKHMEAEEHIGYVRKVLGIVSVQMAATFLLCVLASINESIGKGVSRPGIQIFALILMLGCFIAIACYKEARRTVPYNYVLLLGATAGEAFFLAAVAAELKVASVLTAIMATCFATVGLFLAAMKTASTVDRDTLVRNMTYGLIGAFFLNVFMILFIVFMYNPKDQGLVIAVGVIMCLIAGAYIMFALLFIIVPGIEDRDDYILGALRLYMEIARLFFWLMQLLGEKK